MKRPFYSLTELLKVNYCCNNMHKFIYMPVEMNQKSHIHTCSQQYDGVHFHFKIRNEKILEQLHLYSAVYFKTNADLSQLIWIELNLSRKYKFEAEATTTKV